MIRIFLHAVFERAGKPRGDDAQPVAKDDLVGLYRGALAELSAMWEICEAVAAAAGGAPGEAELVWNLKTALRVLDKMRKPPSRLLFSYTVIPCNAVCTPEVATFHQPTP